MAVRSFRAGRRVGALTVDDGKEGWILLVLLLLLVEANGTGKVKRLLLDGGLVVEVLNRRDGRFDVG